MNWNSVLSTRDYGKSFRIFVSVSALAIFAGCQKETPKSEQAQVETPISSAIAKTTTTSVTPDRTETVESPATAELAVADSDPQTVCRKFLNALQMGNRIAAENLLTRAALQVTGKAGLVLEPLGGPQSRFEVMEPRYATIKNEIAYVDCQITDLDNGVETSFAVSWVVKKQNNGWRISGLLMELEEGRPIKLVSFENLQDVEDIKWRAAEAFADANPNDKTTRQANLPSAEDAAIRK